jgi:aquaporin Z
MLAAAEVYVRTKGGQSVACAKLHHDNDKRCIFCGKPRGKISSERISSADEHLNLPASAET